MVTVVSSHSAAPAQDRAIGPCRPPNPGTGCWLCALLDTGLAEAIEDDVRPVTPAEVAGRAPGWPGRP
jgi:hypothetical protein